VNVFSYYASRSSNGIVAKCDFGTVQYNQVVVGMKIIPDFNIVAVIAVKSLLYEKIVLGFAQ